MQNMLCVKNNHFLLLLRTLQVTDQQLNEKAAKWPRYYYYKQIEVSTYLNWISPVL